jgi:hypothetical protein
MTTSEDEYDEGELSTAHTGAINILRQVLMERKQAVEANPDLIRTDLLTQSGVYYEARPRYIAAGINPSKQGKKFRSNQIRNIEPICEEMGVTREEIGIFAQARTSLYFRGEKCSVDFKNLEELMKKGTDLILIEKEGQAEVNRPFSDPAGIAILNSIGFVVRYASRLAKLSKETGANIAMVTDFDVSGLSMARALPNVPRLGIGFGTLKYFGLTREEVEEEYHNEKPTRRGQKTGYRHWKGLLNMGPAKDEEEETFKVNMEYLRKKRIELDSVVRKVGNQRFWEYIAEMLTNEFPTRDYNRAIKVPTYVFPDVLTDLADALRRKTTEILYVNVRQTKEEFEDYEGIIKDVNQEESDIEEQFKDVITMNANLAPILKKMQKLLEDIREIKSE